MKKQIITAVLLIGFVFTGCYHATVDTGKSPSGEVIEEPFALSFVYGLIPPSTVDVANECSNGVAKVETQISFVNGLVRFLTGGLFTPMNIKVTCAAGGMMSDVESSENKTLTIKEGASEKEVQKTYEDAANEVMKSGDAVYIQYE